MVPQGFWLAGGGQMRQGAFQMASSLRGPALPAASSLIAFVAGWVIRRRGDAVLLSEYYISVQFTGWYT
jgi:hypothetical protein